jgi:hypothetical protein
MLNSSDSGSGSVSSSRLDLDLDDADSYEDDEDSYEDDEDSYEDEDEGSFSNFVGSDGIESSLIHCNIINTPRFCIHTSTCTP